MAWMLDSTISSFRFQIVDLIENNILTSEELDKIEKIGDVIELKKAEVGDRVPEVSLETRDTDINWLSTVDYEWLYRKMTDLINNINQSIYKFDLTYLEQFQYTVYNEGQFYKAHVDMMPNVSYYNHHRKLSFSLQLTDENSYEGGDLLYFNGSKDEGELLPRKRGVISFFPSYCLHRVTPVTKGQRRCLVGWANGPRFK